MIMDNDHGEDQTSYERYEKVQRMEEEFLMMDQIDTNGLKSPSTIPVPLIP
jgi:hypothetical protein